MSEINQPQPYQQPASQPQPPMYVQQPIVVAPVQPTSGLAVASMVLGIVGALGGWCAFGIPCLLAVIFGHVALLQMKASPMAGRGMAIAGLVLGYVFVGPMAVFTILGGIGSVLAAAA